MHAKMYLISKYTEGERGDFIYLNIYVSSGHIFFPLPTLIWFAFANSNFLRKNTTN